MVEGGAGPDGTERGKVGAMALKGWKLGKFGAGIARQSMEE